MCNATTTSNMQTWWTDSTLSATGIYYGGVSRSCANTIITPDWITTIEGQGWGLMPLWVGPQAPCACDGPNPPCNHFPHVFPNNTTQAAMQGKTQADSASAAATALGLGKTVIYYDMENYSSATCGAERLIAFKKERGWQNLHLYSDTTGDYTRTYVSAEDADIPALNVFTRRDGTIRHFWSGEMGPETADPGQDPRGAPDIDPLWTILDLTPEGRGADFYPKLD